MAVAVSLALAACGGDEGPTSVSAPQTTTQPSASSAPLAIISTAPTAYEWDVLGVGKSIHVDATEPLTAVPGKYKGLKFLKTANADRFLSAASAVGFEISKEVTILVAYDNRGAPNRPSWLAAWSDTGDSVTTSATTYNLYSKRFPRGTVTLGGNELGLNTYAVVVDDGTALGNAPPTISGNPPESVSANRRYEFRPSATDADGDRLVFSASNLPPWATLDTTTGRVSGTPTTAAIRAYDNIVISVSDGDSASSLAAFTVQVTPPGMNSPPTISGPAVITGTQFLPYVFQPTASDPDGDPLTFTIANKPRWATFNSSTGRLAGTPDRGDAGTDPNVSIQVSDGSTTTSLPPFTIRIYAPGEQSSGAPSSTNEPPQIGGSPPTSAVVGAAYVFDAWAGDAEGDTLTFSIANRPSWASFSNAGRLSGTPGASHVGVYGNIRISVSDGHQNVALAPFSITVSRAGAGAGAGPAPANRAPLISGTPPMWVLIGSQYSFTPTASDPDDNALTFTISNQPSWANFNSATGRLSGTPGAGAVGTYNNIVIRVSDGQATTALAAFNVTVTAVATGSATLSWTPPTRNTDGSPLNNLAGYRVYWGSSQGNYSNSVTLNNAGLTSYVVEQLTPGTWHFVATAVNAQGVESSFSNSASKTIR